MHAFDESKVHRNHGKFSHTQGAAGAIQAVVGALAGAAPGKAIARKRVGAPEHRAHLAAEIKYARSKVKSKAARSKIAHRARTHKAAREGKAAPEVRKRGQGKKLVKAERKAKAKADKAAAKAPKEKAAKPAKEAKPKTEKAAAPKEKAAAEHPKSTIPRTREGTPEQRSARAKELKDKRAKVKTKAAKSKIAQRVREQRAESRGLPKPVVRKRGASLKAIKAEKKAAEKAKAAAVKTKAKAAEKIAEAREKEAAKQAKAKEAKPKPVKKEAASASAKLGKAARKRASEPESLAIEKHGDVSQEKVAEARKIIDGLPESVKTRLAERGIKVAVGHKIFDACPDLAGQSPRGWSAGSDWSEAEGCYHPPTNRIVACQTSRQGDRQIESPRFAGVLRHETGHAFDAASGYHSNSSEFEAAYKADMESIQPRNKGELGYYLQSGSAGRSEAFAEIFAQHLGGGAHSGSDVTKHFPRSHAVVRSLIR